MTQNHKIFHLDKILAEIKASKGLPENLSSEAQLWDEIFKREVYSTPEQLFPLIKEIYGKTYPPGTSVKPISTEYSIERSDTKELTSIRADVTVLIAEKDIYHFECESKKDGTMVIRMFEYDVHIALTYQQSPRTLDFPHSAVLFLSDNRNLPDSLSCTIRFPNGSSVQYQVPAIKVQTYTLEDIRKKHLCILIPFLPLRFRKRISPRKKDTKLSKEELTSFYQEIILILDEEVKNHYLSENNRNIILNLLNKSLIRVLYKDDTLLKEAATMTEPILKLEIDDYIFALNKQAEELFSKDAEIASMHDKLSSMHAEISSKDAEISSKDEALSLKDNEIAALKAQIAKLQNNQL